MDGIDSDQKNKSKNVRDRLIKATVYLNSLINGNLMYDEQITHFGLFLIAGLASPIAIKIIQLILAPSIPRLRAATTTYECGEKPIGTAQVRVNIQFFTFAVVFVVFDILTILFLLWAYSFRIVTNQTTILIVMGLFAALLLFGVFFWMKKGTMSWV
ncbi:MAG: NADH-quinone oxidoreductase subunit A [Candidatus Hodarchaeales archaeon]|jgi:NADH-quinone oxidoreductase subunit A